MKARRREDNAMGISYVRMGKVEKSPSMMLTYVGAGVAGAGMAVLSGGGYMRATGR